MNCPVCSTRIGSGMKGFFPGCDHAKVVVPAMNMSRERHKEQKLSDGQPYSIHIHNVVEVHRVFGFNDNAARIAACYLHDVVEDTDTTIEEIRDTFGDEIAEIVWKVTDEPGKSRKERKASTYKKLAGHRDGTIVKLCDRIANVEYGGGDNQKYFQMYKEEYRDFRNALYVPGMCDILWEYLDNLLFHDFAVMDVSFDHLEQQGMVIYEGAPVSLQLAEILVSKNYPGPGMSVTSKEDPQSLVGMGESGFIYFSPRKSV